jgi:ornithine cyclodeaminase/alanine dehydrogenase-like protein (mu-crystallin family)
MIRSHSKSESALYPLIEIKDADKKVITSKEDTILVKRKQILEEKIEECQKKKKDIISNQIEIEKEIQQIAHVAIEASKRNSDERILIFD